MDLSRTIGKRPIVERLKFLVSSIRRPFFERENDAKRNIIGQLKLMVNNLTKVNGSLN